MEFPLYFLLILYAAFLVFWAVFSLIGVYHLLRFGFRNFTTFFIILIYFVVSALMFYFSYQYLNQIDWQTNVSVFKGFLNNDNPFGP